MEGSIKILSHDVEIVQEDPKLWERDAMGRSFVKSGEILINGTMHRDAKRSTLIHEAAHYISDLLSLEMTEQQIDGVAMGMFSLLKDNPEFFNKVFYNNKGGSNG